MGQCSQKPCCCSSEGNAPGFGGPSFLVQDGFPGEGHTWHDILVESMTIEEAKVKCAALKNCKGFCHPGGPTTGKVECHFKGQWDEVRGSGGPSGWTSYMRQDLVSAHAALHDVTGDDESNESDNEQDADGTEKMATPGSLTRGKYELALEEMRDKPEHDASLQNEWRQFLSKDGVFYKGQWLGHQRHGFGMLEWPDGAKYHGEWSHDRAEGKGKFEHGNGDVYIGEWKNGKAHGCGIHRHHQSLFTYEGDWVNDQPSGHGVERWAEGSGYEGTFLDGLKEGCGVYNWPDNSSYSGTWTSNCIGGVGTLHSGDGRTFQGQWSDSVIHGIGTFTWPDGRKYSGQYLRDKRDGFGIFVWPDGRCHQGFWKRGKEC